MLAERVALLLGHERAVPARADPSSASSETQRNTAAGRAMARLPTCSAPDPGPRRAMAGRRLQRTGRAEPREYSQQQRLGRARNS